MTEQVLIFVAAEPREPSVFKGFGDMKKHETAQPGDSVELRHFGISKSWMPVTFVTYTKTGFVIETSDGVERLFYWGTAELRPQQIPAVKAVDCIESNMYHLMQHTFARIRKDGVDGATIEQFYDQMKQIFNDGRSQISGE